MGTANSMRADCDFLRQEEKVNIPQQIKKGGPAGRPFGFDSLLIHFGNRLLAAAA